MTTERIAKYIAHSDMHCSRRQAEKIVSSGTISVNNELITDLSHKVDLEKDIVKIGGRTLKRSNETSLYVYHKPRGVITSQKDEKNRKVVFDYLPKGLKSIGRLDFNTEGLLLLTNNGQFAQYMEHPNNQIKRIYKVRVFGEVSSKKILQLQDGIKIEGIKYAPIYIKKQTVGDSLNSWLIVTLQEGKNREIRKVMNNFLKVQVNRLIRVQYGRYKLNNLPINEHIKISDDLLQKDILQMNNADKNYG